MQLTLQILEQGKSRYGCWSAKQFALLGLNFHKLKKGWMGEIVGQDFPEDVIAEFIRLKDAHLEKGGKCTKRFRKQWTDRNGKWLLRFEPFVSEAEAQKLWSRVEDEPDDAGKAFKTVTEGL